MKGSDLYTYTNGPSFHMHEDVTQSKMNSIVRNFQFYLGPEYLLDLEPISEGGIIFKNWPGKDPEDKSSFKTIRLCLPGGKWPYIEPEKTLSEWKDSNVVIFQSKSEYGIKQEWNTFLKAFHGAPCWTLEELNAFSKTMRDHGYFLVKGRRGTSDVPKKFAKTTISNGALGQKKIIK